MLDTHSTPDSRVGPFVRRAVSALLTIALSAIATPLVSPVRAADRDVSSLEASTVRSSQGIVASDRPEASRIGAAILEKGGTAADAGVATLLALGVYNPFSSGLGGGGFCLHRAADDGDVTVLDFREEAPGKATRDMFVEEGDVQRKDKVRGGLSVGVPGEPGGLWALSHRFGKLKWRRLVEPALRSARRGYTVKPILVERLEDNAELMKEISPELVETFQDGDGDWVEVGDTLKRPKLAKLLRLLQKEGPNAFYRGPVADDLVEAVNEAGGIFQRKDLEHYGLRIREPVRGEYRGYTVFSMPPSSSGGTAIVETLNILEGYDLAEYGRSAGGVHRIVEALKHAFADRAGWLGDTDFVDVPLDRLTSESYASKIRSEIKPEGVLPLKAYGTKAPVPDHPGTTHLSVVDDEQNMLACTSTINLSFGSKVFVPEWGLVLNNEMGDFTAQPGVANNYGLIGTEQNAITPGKRPLSSMSPTLVLDPKGRPYMAVGASGGPTIITGTLMAFLNTVDFGMGPAEAIEAPRIHHQWLPNEIYMEAPMGIRSRLESFGHEIEIRPAWSNVQMIVRTKDGRFTGVSDPRKGGAPASVESVDASSSRSTRH